ncbi:MAG: threonine synthase [Methanomassiliicoccales archaeon]|nr:threonine synthase [Methanomassiliicoccales archaeon]
MSYVIKCFECGAEIGNEMLDACPGCGGLLNVEMDLSRMRGRAPSDLCTRPMGVWRYAPFLPVPAEKAVTIQEGGTPLYDCRALAKELGLARLHVKYEGANPTGSFKDRGMTVGVSKAVQLGCKVVGCASTGNTSASLAAYAAKAGLGCVVLLPSGKVALGKLAQAMFYGAKVISIDGNFDDALNVVRQLAREGHLYLLNSINPFRPEGQKTIAFEILDQLELEVPDAIVLPVGNAANIWAVYKGLTEWRELGWIDRMPRLIGVQATGSNPISAAFKAGKEDFVPVDHPETVATAIRIGNPASGRKALKAIYETKGLATEVTDEEILAAQRLLGKREGVGVEPASAASVAGVVRLRQEGLVSRDEKVVCICTGNLLKDPDTVIKNAGQVLRAGASLDEVKRLVLG